MSADLLSTHRPRSTKHFSDGVHGHSVRFVVLIFPPNSSTLNSSSWSFGSCVKTITTTTTTTTTNNRPSKPLSIHRWRFLQTGYDWLEAALSSSSLLMLLRRTASALASRARRRACFSSRTPAARRSPSVSEAMRPGTSQPTAASAAPYMGMPMDTSQSETLPPPLGDRGLRQSSVRPPDGI